MRQTDRHDYLRLGKVIQGSSSVLRGNSSIHTRSEIHPDPQKLLVLQRMFEVRLADLCMTRDKVKPKTKWRL